MPKLFFILCFLFFGLPAFSQPQTAKKVIHIDKNTLSLIPRRTTNASNLLLSYMYRGDNGGSSNLHNSFATSPPKEYTKNLLKDATKAMPLLYLEFFCPQKARLKKQICNALKSFQESGVLNTLQNIAFIDFDGESKGMVDIFDILASMPKLSHVFFSGEDTPPFAEQFSKLKQISSVSLFYDDCLACLPIVLALPKIKNIWLRYSPELDTIKFLDKATHLNHIGIQVPDNQIHALENAKLYCERLQKELPSTQIQIYY